VATNRASELATLSALLESFPGPALLVDLKRRVRAVNGAFRARIPRRGATSEAHCFELLHGRRRRCASKGHRCPLELCADTGGPVVAFHGHVAGGRTYPEQTLLRPLVDDHGKVVACLATLRPIRSSITHGRRMPGKSAIAVAAVRALLPRLASGRKPVLLVGETGTGKASVARAIHRLSRSRGPFEERSACELTAEGLRDLLAGESARGTLYLSDVVALDREAQEALWEGLARHDGPWRLILGTDRDLDDRIAAGAFRADLRARLAVSTLRLPALRERVAELPAIAARLLRQAEGAGRTLSPGALERLRVHPFPGNLDELAAVLRHASLMAAGPVVEAEDLPDWVVTTGAEGGSSLRGRTPRGSHGR
jgi:transcriptional regulator of acetoin/glycerol metabolism